MSEAGKFRALYSGYQKAHGRFISSGKKVKGKLEGKSFVEHAPPTLELYEQHLEGSYSLGIFPLNDNEQCYFSAVDIDTREDGIERAIDVPALAKKVHKIDPRLIVTES